jgi:hypothetical protein
MNARAASSQTPVDGYGKVAVRAVELVVHGTCASPSEAWDIAAREVFPDSPSQQVKSCPRSTFLGLCEEGLVIGVPAGQYTRSRENKADARRAAALLVNNPALADGSPQALWNAVLAGRRKVHNSQMRVVLALHRHGLLRRG